MIFPDKLVEQLRDTLKKILLELELLLPEDAQQKILQYLGLLVQWNKVYNLTAIADPQEMLVKHIADSLAIAPYLTGQRFLDVGSGAGLPGIPLALLFPERDWTLLDSNGKKTRFLVQAKGVLALENITVVHERVENFKPAQCFDGVIARAWAQLNVMIASTRHLYCKSGRLWAMKGVYPTEELQEVRESFQIFNLKVPGLTEQRHLVSLEIGSNL